MQYGESPVVGFGEKVSFRLYSSDQFDNFRETVWSVNAPLEMQVYTRRGIKIIMFGCDKPAIPEQLFQANVSSHHATENMNNLSSTHHLFIYTHKS